MEACSHRALATRKDSDVDDLLVGLVTADCAARAVLLDYGITEVRLLPLTARH